MKKSQIIRSLTLLTATIFLINIKLSAQGTLTGFVVDDEFNTPIEKAVITIPGTLISVLTDQQGKYVLKLVAGDYFMEVNYPGYFGKQYNMTVTDDITTPMFIVKLQANAVGRTTQRRITNFENNRRFPQEIEDFTSWRVIEQTGNQEFNELFRRVPSVSFFSNGSGFNDSGIAFRGNKINQTSYTFNGISLNNPETGYVGSSMLSGLTDWAGQIQVGSGQAANLQGQTKSGGLINILSFLPHEKPGAEIAASYGNNGFLKTSATVHSGLSKKKMASSIQISRTSGNGLTPNTAFEQYSFFVNIHKELNHFHTLVLNLNGVMQQHDRNTPDSIGSYNRYGTMYNRNWGFLSEKPLSWSTSYKRSPLVSLTHFWQPRIKTHLTTQIFAQFNRSAQLVPNTATGNEIPRDSAGLVLFDDIHELNNGSDITEAGIIRLPGADGILVHSETSGITTLAAIDSENRFGLRSVLTHKYSKKLELSSSFNLEHYQANHFGAVHNLLGANRYISLSDVNRPDGFAVGKLFQAGFFPTFNSADPTAYSYQSSIQSGGLSMRLNYQLPRFYWYLEGTASLQNIRRTDRFNYLATAPDRQTEFTLLPGGRAQTGIRINFPDYHSIRLRTSYGSYQPLFTTVFPSGNNWENLEAANEQVWDVELGYTIFSRRLKVEASAYRSQISNRKTIRYSNLNSDDMFGVVNGLAELHQGIELKTSYKLNKNLQLNLNGSLGDWKYSKDAKAQLYNSDNQLTGTNELLLKNVVVSNAPQFSLFAEADYRWAHNFYVRLNYLRADQIYAPFSLYDFQSLTDRNDFIQWKLPAYQLLGASGNYLLKIGKSQTLNLFFGVNNILNTEYIEQSFSNIPEGNSRYTSNQVYYGSGRAWFAGMKLQF